MLFLICHAGEKFGADGDQATATALKAIQDAAADEAKHRLAEKAAKKAAFNAEYDVGKSPPSQSARPYSRGPAILARKSGQLQWQDTPASIQPVTAGE